MNDFDNQENMIEFLKGSRTCTVSFTNLKHVNKIKSLYKKNPDEFSYFVENKDGSVCAKIPLKWIKISNPQRESKEMTEEEKDVLRERLRIAREKRR